MRFPSVNGPAFTAAHASSYVEGTSRKVPGLAALHRMTSMLVAERAPVQARVLVLGAGGGMELKALADENSDWSFCGIDPSADMLRVAEQTVGPHLPRVHLQQGYIGAAPEGPFDAAVCLLTLHFVGRAQRLDTLEQIRRLWCRALRSSSRTLVSRNRNLSARPGSPATSRSAEQPPAKLKVQDRRSPRSYRFSRQRRTRRCFARRASRMFACSMRL